MTKRWIQGAIRNKKKGALHRQLGYSEGHTIPRGVLKDIVESPIGTKFRTSHKTGTITPLLKRRAVLANNLRNIRKKK